MRDWLIIRKIRIEGYLLYLAIKWLGRYGVKVIYRR